MAKARLETRNIHDLAGFFEESRRAFGFPDWFGRNAHAWIDCLTYVREGDGLSSYELGPVEVLEIEVADAVSFRRRVPKVAEALEAWTAFVNARQVEMGELPALALCWCLEADAGEGPAGAWYPLPPWEREVRSGDHTAQ